MQHEEGLARATLGVGIFKSSYLKSLGIVKLANTSSFNK